MPTMPTEITAIVYFFMVAAVGAIMYMGSESRLNKILLPLFSIGGLVFVYYMQGFNLADVVKHIR